MDSSSQTWNTIPRLDSKKEQSDLIIRTRDLLPHVNGTSIARLEASVSQREGQDLRGGDGGIVVPAKGRIPGYLFDKRETGSLLRLSPLSKLNAKGYNPTPIFKRGISSKPLADIKIYQDAYHKIKTNAGSMTPGVDNMTVDGMSNKRLTKIMEDVKTWRYECKPARRVYIPKANGKVRPLGIPSSDDKIVQTAVKTLLEPKCEEIFHPKSFAYRPKKSAHQALMSVRGMVGIT